mmetsp:Transcript_18143/g.50475  ORF Transcript_18143/g.50475 Transcript_18143/m.50475 type:complete len:287 (-) Transcript_18143:60-920(-)
MRKDLFVVADRQHDLVALVQIKDVLAVFLAPQGALHVDPDTVFHVHGVTRVGRKNLVQDARNVHRSDAPRVPDRVRRSGRNRRPVLGQDAGPLGLVHQHGNVGRKRERVIVVAKCLQDSLPQGPGLLVFLQDEFQLGMLGHDRQKGGDGHGISTAIHGFKDGRVDAVDGRRVDLDAAKSPAAQLLNKGVVPAEDLVDPALAEVGGEFHFFLRSGVFVVQFYRLRQEGDPIGGRIPRLTFLVGPKEGPKFEKGVGVGVHDELLGMDGIVDPAETHGPEFHGLVCMYW